MSPTSWREPATSVTSAPRSHRPRASAPATNAEPPRGKKSVPDTTRNARSRKPRSMPSVPCGENERGRDRPPVEQLDPVLLARPVDELAVADERGRAAAVEVERVARAEVDEQVRQLGERQAGVVGRPPVAGDREHVALRQRDRAARMAA